MARRDIQMVDLSRDDSHDSQRPHRSREHMPKHRDKGLIERRLAELRDAEVRDYRAYKSVMGSSKSSRQSSVRNARPSNFSKPSDDKFSYFDQQGESGGEELEQLPASGNGGSRGNRPSKSTYKEPRRRSRAIETDKRSTKSMNEREPYNAGYNTPTREGSVYGTPSSKRRRLDSAYASPATVTPDRTLGGPPGTPASPAPPSRSREPGLFGRQARSQFAGSSALQFSRTPTRNDTTPVTQADLERLFGDLTGVITNLQGGLHNVIELAKNNQALEARVASLEKTLEDERAERAEEREGQKKEVFDLVAQIKTAISTVSSKQEEVLVLADKLTAGNGQPVRGGAHGGPRQLQAAATPSPFAGLGQQQHANGSANGNANSYGGGAAPSQRAPSQGYNAY